MAHKNITGLRTGVEHVDFGQFLFAVLQKVFVELNKQAVQIFGIGGLGRRSFFHDFVQHFFHVLEHGQEPQELLRGTCKPGNGRGGHPGRSADTGRLRTS